MNGFVFAVHHLRLIIFSLFFFTFTQNNTSYAQIHIPNSRNYIQNLYINALNNNTLRFNSINNLEDINQNSIPDIWSQNNSQTGQLIPIDVELRDRQAIMQTLDISVQQVINIRGLFGLNWESIDASEQPQNIIIRGNEDSNIIAIKHDEELQNSTEGYDEDYDQVIFYFIGTSLSTKLRESLFLAVSYKFYNYFASDWSAFDGVIIDKDRTNYANLGYIVLDLSVLYYF